MLKYCFVPPDFFPICGSKKNLQENTIAGRVGGQSHALPAIAGLTSYFNFYPEKSMSEEEYCSGCVG